MPNAAEIQGDHRALSIKLPLDLWELVSREAHRRTLETGRCVSATAVVRSAVAVALGADPDAANASKPRKVTMNHVTTPRARSRTRATGCNVHMKAGG